MDKYNQMQNKLSQFKAAAHRAEVLKQELAAVKAVLRHHPVCSIRHCCNKVALAGVDTFMCHNHHLQTMKALTIQSKKPPPESSATHCPQCERKLILLHASSADSKDRVKLCTKCGGGRTEYEEGRGREYEHEKYFTYASVDKLLEWLDPLLASLDVSDHLDSELDARKGKCIGFDKELKPWEVYMPNQWEDVWCKEVVASLRIYKLVVLTCGKKHWGDYWKKVRYKDH